MWQPQGPSPMLLGLGECAWLQVSCQILALSLNQIKSRHWYQETERCDTHPKLSCRRSHVGWALNESCPDVWKTWDHLGWLIHDVFGHRMQNPVAQWEISNTSDALIHHLILYIHHGCTSKDSSSSSSSSNTFERYLLIPSSPLMAGLKN